MIQTLKKMLGLGQPETDFKTLVQNGAQIIDVRTPGEFLSGHIPGAVNIPLYLLNQNLSKISKNKPVITCCVSGTRSASARKMLRANGFNEVYNGGGWVRLQGEISEQ